MNSLSNYKNTTKNLFGCQTTFETYFTQKNRHKNTVNYPQVNNFCNKINIARRTLVDRSFRLANVSDLFAAQEYKHKIEPHLWNSYEKTVNVKERDMSKQLVIDLSHEQGYRRGHIKGAVNLPLARFDFTQQIDVYGGITQDDVYHAMKKLGVSNGTSEIILYDNSGLVCLLLVVLFFFYYYYYLHLLLL